MSFLIGEFFFKYDFKKMIKDPLSNSLWSITRTFKEKDELTAVDLSNSYRGFRFR